MIYIQELCQEAVLWKMMDHPNVLNFIGICRLNDVRLQSGIALASPWMKNGNLLAYVENIKSVNRSTLVSHILIILHFLAV